jgi:hypothetical protein
MSNAAWRAQRALAIACVFLVNAGAVAAAFAAPQHVAPGPALQQLTATDAVGGSDVPELAERRLGLEDDSSVAPRVAEARAAVELSGPARLLPAPRNERLAPGREDRLASRSGCAANHRWCLAHATSTQAP